MNKDIRKSLIQLAQLSTVGIAMAVAIFGSLYIGIYLDRRLDTGYIFTVILLIMGIVAGFKNFFTLVKRYATDKTPTRHEEGEAKNQPERKDRDDKLDTLG